MTDNEMNMLEININRTAGIALRKALSYYVNTSVECNDLDEIKMIDDLIEDIDSFVGEQ